MLVGYARVSTAEGQEAGFDAQVRDLRAIGCEKVFAEKVSSVAARREQLEALLEFVREGDCVAVVKPCRPARSVADLLSIVSRLEAKGVGLRILSMGGSEVDTTSATGRLMLVLLSAIADFERRLMLERQREGIARAKAEGKYRGRAPTAMAKSTEIRRLHGEGVKPMEIARRVGVSRASVYRSLGTSP